MTDVDGELLDAQSCGNCWYWRRSPHKSRSGAIVRVDAPACHRLPPMPHIGADLGYKWPCTDKRDWCGEWRPCQEAADAPSDSRA